MSWVAPSPSSFVNEVVGDGQCVAFVRAAAEAPATPAWRRGALVKGNAVEQGTAIATFDRDLTYGNHVDGRSHAAIFHEEHPEGLLVWDQWFKHPVSPRVIRFNDTDGLACDDGNAFYVIEHS